MPRTKPLPAAPARSRARAAPTPARPYHHGNLRAALLDAADALLAAHGVQGLTLREVARAAGVSHGAPYHHFTSLDDLLAAVAERGFSVLGDAVAEAVAVADPRERLLGVTSAYVGCALAHPERFRLMFGPLLARQDEFPAFRDAAHRAFRHVTTASQAHDDAHGASLALAGWCLSHGLSHLLIDGVLQGVAMPSASPQGIARTLAAHLLGPMPSAPAHAPAPARTRAAVLPKTRSGGRASARSRG